MVQFLSTYFFVLISVQLVQSSGVFELKVHSFTNTSSSVCQQSRDCQVFFHVCLNYTQDDISYRLACSNGTGVTVTFSTDQSFTSTCAPITVPFNLKRLTTVSVIIKAWDAKSSNDHPTENLNNISHFATKINLTIGQKWSQHVHFGEQSELRLSYRVVCDRFYNGADCSVVCRSRDDYFGHFTCDSAGNKLCLPGWKGKDCRQPICLSGCSEEHGTCKTPGKCMCLYGWRGLHCDECVPFPGCIHGTCEQPWQCNCEKGWGGLLCNMDL